MRSYNNLYEPMLKDDYIKQCFLDASKKKKNRNDVQEILNNLDKHTELLKENTEDFETALQIRAGHSSLCNRTVQTDCDEWIV